MIITIKKFFPLFLCAIAGCATMQQKYQVSTETVQPGTAVTMGGQSVPLYNGALKVGDNIHSVLKDFDLGIKGKVAVVSVVPSVDTPVCEEQTHVLGETDKLDASVARVTVSRDLPMAQNRFGKEAKLTNIAYVSDYKDGSFGKTTGLMIKGPELLARAVLVVDQGGIIKHMQVVPETSQLPDMEAAFSVANDLAKGSVHN